MLQYRCAFNKQCVTLSRYEIEQVFTNLFGETLTSEAMIKIDEMGKFFIKTESGTISICPTYH